MTRAIAPSPARAAPHDAEAWFPVPDPSGLPTIAALLAAAEGSSASDVRDVAVVDLVRRELVVTLSPARAEPHDAATWLPLPVELDTLPGVRDLLEPSPEVTASVVAEAEALVAQASAVAEAAVAPSPARAVPHDAATWLPLPDPDTLEPFHPPVPAQQVPVERPRRRRGLAVAARRPRTWLLVLLVAATVGAAVRLTGDAPVSANAAVAPFRVTVDLDGEVAGVMTTARTAAALGRQLDVGKLVAVRDAPRSLQADSHVVLRTRKSGQLEVDGQVVPYDSASLTVAELLAVSKVRLEGEDTTVPPPASVLVDGTKVTVVRVGAATKQTTEPIAFTEERVADASIPIGETRELRPGRDGVATITWRAREENGVEVGRTPLSVVETTAPVSRLVGYGTKADWHWDALAQCETGGRWSTVDPAGSQGYHGGLGIYQPNWTYYGGLEFAPNAGLATREEQIIVGQRIFDEHGWYAWGCARNALDWV